MPDQQPASPEVTYISRPEAGQPEPLQPGWSKAPTLTALKADLSAAKISHDAVMSKIQTWRDHSKGVGGAAPVKVMGRSNVVPKLIRKHNEWRYPSLSEPFLGQEELFKCRPRTWEDREAARQAQTLLNYQFDTCIDKVTLIDDLVRAAVDDGTVILEMGWHQVMGTRTVSRPEYVYETLLDMDPGVVQELDAAIALKTENPNAYMDLDEAIRESVEASLREEAYVVARPTGVVLEIQETFFEANHPTVEVCDPANLFVDPSCGGNLDKAMYVIRSFETNYGEMKARGIYKNLEQVPWEQLTLQGEVDHTTHTPDTFRMEGKARNKVAAYRYYGFCDVHGDGTLVSIVATWVGDVLVQLEETPFPDKKVPYAVGTLMPTRYSLFGEPDAELLIDNQATVGALTRGVIDLMGRSANAQQGVPKGFLDVPNKMRFERGMDYEYNPMLGNPLQQLVTHKYPEIPQSAMGLIAHNLQDAGSLTGVQTHDDPNGQAYAANATVARGVLAASSKRETSILRRLARVVSIMGTKISQMNMEFLSEEEIVRITNEKFVTIRREDIKGNYDVQSDVSSAEADAAKSHKLAFLLQTLGNSIDFSITKLIMADIARLDKMPTLAHNLENFEPQPDPMAVAEAEARVAEIQAKVAKLQAEAMEAEARGQYYAAAARAMVSTSDLKDLEFVEQETGTKHARDMQKIQSQGEALQDLEVTRALLSNKPDGGPQLPRLQQAIMFNAISRNRE